MIIQPRPFNLRKTLTVLAVLAVAFYFYYQRPPPPQLWHLRGATMGTTYSIKYFDNRSSLASARELKQAIDDLFTEVNRQMSTYLPDSEISRFNRLETVEPLAVSPGFYEVTRQALEVCRDTGGAFSPTLNTLIEAWGFGPKGTERALTPDEVAAALALTGCDAVELEDGLQLRKIHSGATLNLNAIAKGWALDEAATLLQQNGITNYFVEIGGDVMARGISEKLRPWRVGIDRPADGALPGEAFDLIVAIDARGLATSGDYRNFIVDETGARRSHLLDPRTGYPVQSPLASVSVIAPTGALADALATALFVMGRIEGLAFVEERLDIEAVFIEHTDDGKWATFFSSGFEPSLITP